MSLIKQETVSLSDDSDQDYDSPTINSQADSLGSRTSTSPSSKRTSFSRQNTPSSIASSLPSESCDAETDNAAAASATPGASSNTATSAVRNVKARVPENFVPMTTRDLRQYSGRYSANTELWLVQVPQGFDVSTLDNMLDSSLLTYSGSQTVKIKAQEHRRRFSIHSYRDSSDCKKMSMVVADSSGQVSVGQDLQNMLVFTETFKPPHHVPSSSVPAPKKPVPMPSGLKVRFTTFGADAPCPSLSRKSKKRKKESTSPGDELTFPKKKRHKVGSPEKGDNTPASSPTKLYHIPEATTPRKKSHTSTLSPSSTTAVIPDPIVKKDPILPQVLCKKSTKRQLDASSSQDGETSVEDTSSPKKKKKKSKHRHSESAVFQNGEEEDVVDSTKSALHKPKKEKVKVEEDTSFGDGLFVVDRGGSWSNRGSDSLMNILDSSGKHKKKSKKEKKELWRTVM